MQYRAQNNAKFVLKAKNKTCKSLTYKEPTRCNFAQYCFLLTASSLYMFRTPSAPIIRTTKDCSSSHWCVSWVGMMYIQ